MPACITPLDISLKNNGKTYRVVSVPCGKCANCKANRLNEYLCRVLLDFQYYKCQHFYFITLTFNESNYIDDIVHVRKCVNRFRSHIVKDYPKVRFIGSYQRGTKNNRLHVHLLAWNIPIADYYNFLDFVKHCWHYGFVQIKPNLAQNLEKSLFYSLRYQLRPEDKIARFIVPRSPSLGSQYLRNKKFMQDLLSNRCIVVNNRTFAVPRCYMDSLLLKAQRYNDWQTKHDLWLKDERAEIKMKRYIEIFGYVPNDEEIYNYETNLRDSLDSFNHALNLIKTL